MNEADLQRWATTFGVTPEELADNHKRLVAVLAADNHKRLVAVLAPPAQLTRTERVELLAEALIAEQLPAVLSAARATGTAIGVARESSRRP